MSKISHQERNLIEYVCYTIRMYNHEYVSSWDVHRIYNYYLDVLDKELINYDGFCIKILSYMSDNNLGSPICKDYISTDEYSITCREHDNEVVEYFLHKKHIKNIMDTYSKDFSSVLEERIDEWEERADDYFNVIGLKKDEYFE